MEEDKRKMVKNKEIQKRGRRNRNFNNYKTPAKQGQLKGFFTRISNVFGKNRNLMNKTNHSL